MKALLRKMFYESGGRTTLCICAAALIILSAAGILFRFPLHLAAGTAAEGLICCKPVMMLKHDFESRWCRYRGTLPFSRNQFVDASYLFLLLMVLLFGVLMLPLNVIYQLRDPSLTNLCMPASAYYFLLIPLFLSVALPCCLAAERTEKAWLGSLLSSIPLALLIPLFFWTFVLILEDGLSAGVNVWSIFGKAVPKAQAALILTGLFTAPFLVYLLSWLFSRRLFGNRRQKRRQNPPAGNSDDDDAVLIMQNMMWN